MEYQITINHHRNTCTIIYTSENRIDERMITKSLQYLEDTPGQRMVASLLPKDPKNPEDKTKKLEVLIIDHNLISKAKEQFDKIVGSKSTRKVA